MMSHAWPIVADGRHARRRAATAPLYALMIVSHRAAALRRRRSCTCSRSRASIALLGDGAVYVAALALQLALLVAAALARWIRARPLLVARYYVLTRPRSPPACGLAAPRHAAGWEPAEGTR